MKRSLAIGLGPTALAGLAIVAAGCGGGYGAAAATPAKSNAAVSTRHSQLGTFLVDGQGRTLYLFEKDKGTASSCSGACASVWPPVAGAKGVAGVGVSSGKLGSTKRADGTSELTYGGHPLYTYAGDAKPGETRGQGLDQFGAEWYVVAPSGKKIDEG